MAIIKDKDIVVDTLTDVAKKMLTAAQTAPKARGINCLATAIVTDGDLQKLAQKMKEIGEKEDNQLFIRDAVNVLNNADVIVLFGTRIKSLGLAYCGYCGFKNCTHKNEYPEVPCAFNTGDLGIAVGSAVGVAMDHRVDNRIMYTVGMAARMLNILGDDVPVVYGIPLSATAKNPFFDRK